MNMLMTVNMVWKIANMLNEHFYLRCYFISEICTTCVGNEQPRTQALRSDARQNEEPGYEVG